MNKNGTPKNSGDCIKRSLIDLFGSSSVASLIDYSQFSDLVDFKALQLVDTSMLKFVHIPTLVFFFKYLGAFFISSIIVGAFVLKMMLISAQVGPSDFSPKVNGDYDYYKNVKLVEDDWDSADNNVVELHTDSSNVLGVSDEALTAFESYAQETAVSDATYVPVKKTDRSVDTTKTAEVAKMADAQYPPCSFEVDGEYYSSGTTVSLADVGEGYVCANYNPGVENSTWTFSKETGLYPSIETAKECSYLSGIEAGSELVVKVYNSETKSVDSCTVTFGP